MKYHYYKHIHLVGLGMRKPFYKKEKRGSYKMAKLCRSHYGENHDSVHLFLTQNERQDRPGMWIAAAHGQERWCSALDVFAECGGHSHKARKSLKSPETPERPRQGWEVWASAWGWLGRGGPGYNLNLKLYTNHLNSEHFSKAKNLITTQRKVVLVFETPTQFLLK